MLFFLLAHQRQRLHFPVAQMGISNFEKQRDRADSYLGDSPSTVLMLCDRQHPLRENLNNSHMQTPKKRFVQNTCLHRPTRNARQA